MTALQSLEALADAIRALPHVDPLDRARAVPALIDTAQRLLADARREAVGQLVADGWTQRDVAAALGVSKQAVSQLLAGEPPAQQDEKLLRVALRILIRPGVSSMNTSQLMQGLSSRADLAVMARRVQAGVGMLNANQVTPDEQLLLQQAAERAGQLLRG